MAHTDERKKGVLDILYTKAGGNTSKCARLTGVDRKTIQKWKEEHEACKLKEIESGELPGPKEIKEKIIRRVNQIITTCTDPKKLMDTYEAISKFEKESGSTKETLFEIIERELTKKE